MTVLLVPGGKYQVSIAQLCHSVYQAFPWMYLCWFARTAKWLIVVSIIICLWGKGNCKHGCYQCSCSFKNLYFPPRLLPWKLAIFFFSLPFTLITCQTSTSDSPILNRPIANVELLGWCSPPELGVLELQRAGRAQQYFFLIRSYSYYCRSNW